jgi:hypothetical protein
MEAFMFGVRRVLWLLGVTALGAGVSVERSLLAQDAPAPPAPVPVVADSRFAVLRPFGARGQHRPVLEREGSLGEGGLRWLAAQQPIDGFWAAPATARKFDTGVSALALLAALREARRNEKDTATLAAMDAAIDRLPSGAGAPAPKVT